MTPGVALSRWTMLWFWTALAALALALAALALGIADPLGHRAQPALLVTVHLVAVGWLSFLMLGALFQFVPVLTAQPLACPRLVLPSYAALLAGLGTLSAGFLTLDGTLPPHFPWLPLAAALLSLGAGLAAVALGATLWRARPLTLAARFVAVGLAGLVLTVALGATFALTLGGATLPAPLLHLTGPGLPLHIAAGLGGWLTLTAVGVSYRLLAMFMLAPEAAGQRQRIALVAAAAALGIGIAGGAVALMAGHGVTGWLATGAVFALAAAAAYGADALRLFRTRLRRGLELNGRMAALALGSAGLALALAVILALAGRLAQQAPALLFLAAFGWLGGLGLTKLYKIVAFLTW